MKITGTQLRKIIKEEIVRMNEGYGRRPHYRPPARSAPRMPGPDEDVMVSYPVPVPPNVINLKEVEEIALPLAIARAEDQFPGREWEIMKGKVKGIDYGVGMRWDRGPAAQDPNASVRVYLIGYPISPDPDLMTGGDQFVQSMEDYGDSDIDLDR